MSDVKRYYVTEAGLVEGQALGRINVVLAADYDSAVQCFLTAAEGCVSAERRERALQQRLTAADERWGELVSAVRSINRSPQYKVMAIDDDEPQYRQRKEWIDWVLGLCDAPAALGEIDLTPKRLAHAESVIEQQNNLIASLRAELVESYRVATHPQGEPVAWLNVATGHVTTSAVVVMDWDDEKEQVQSLYAEQPAPVAVVMPERRADAATEDQRTWLRGWNAYRDELKRLNPSL